MIGIWIFWIMVGLIIYTHVGFSLLLLLKTLIFRRPVKKGEITPQVTIIITAHNEIRSISRKIENLLNLDYPPAKLQIIIASDGSDDGTNAVVEKYSDKGIQLLDLPRRGKILTMNAAVQAATGEILVFSDANSMFAKDALRALVSPFADPEVGAVGGNQCYTAEPNVNIVGLGENLYWNFDRTLKTLQSESGNMTSATGAIHAIRRDLFQPVPLSVCDDLVISTRAILQGKRLAFAREANAYEPVSSSDKDEFKRKVRIITRGLQSIWVVRGLLNPFRFGFYSIQLISHKVLRWLVGWMLLVFFLTSLIIYREGVIYRLAVWGQVLFYTCALLAIGLRGSPLAKKKIYKLLSIPYFFCLANYAAVRAWVYWLLGKRIDIWDSNRQTEQAPPVKLSS